MTKGELLDMLKEYAQEFRKDTGYYKRNRHMHNITEAPQQDVVDAVLVGYINHVAAKQGVDFGLYAKDL